MTSLYEIRDRAQRAEGRQPDGAQLQMQPVNVARRVLPPFTGVNGKRDYRAMYRAICECHERNSPPCSTPTYWEHVTADIEATAAQFEKDPFVVALLNAVYDELEREYQAMRAQRFAR